jgi:hypothetical protein
MTRLTWRTGVFWAVDNGSQTHLCVTCNAATLRPPRVEVWQGHPGEWYRLWTYVPSCRIPPWRKVVLRPWESPGPDADLLAALVEQHATASEPPPAPATTSLQRTAFGDLCEWPEVPAGRLVRIALIVGRDGSGRGYSFDDGIFPGGFYAYVYSYPISEFEALLSGRQVVRYAARFRDDRVDFLEDTEE